MFPYHCLDFLLIRYASSFLILHNSSVDVCLSVFGFQGTGCRSLCSDHFLWKRSSGDGEIRTHDPLLARQVLSQLSYTPEITIILLGYDNSFGFYLIMGYTQWA